MIRDFFKTDKVFSARLSKGDKEELSDHHQQLFNEDHVSMRDYLLALSRKASMLTDLYSQQETAMEQLRNTPPAAEDGNNDNAERLAELAEENDELTEKINTLTAEIESLQNKIQQHTQRAESLVDKANVIGLHPVYKYLLEDIVIRERKRTGKQDLTSYDVLWAAFHEIVKNGPSDRFFGVTYSSTEIKQIISKAKDQE